LEYTAPGTLAGSSVKKSRTTHTLVIFPAVEYLVFGKPYLILQDGCKVEAVLEVKFETRSKIRQPDQGEEKRGCRGWRCGAWWSPTVVG